jgi:hypothetical protein
VIRRFYHQLPRWIDADTRAQAQAHLAALGAQYRPEQLAGLADRLTDCLNPDGSYTDALAKVVAPGMCNPAQQTPCVDGAPTTGTNNLTLPCSTHHHPQRLLYDPDDDEAM